MPSIIIRILFCNIVVYFAVLSVSVFVMPSIIIRILFCNIVVYFAVLSVSVFVMPSIIIRILFCNIVVYFAVLSVSVFVIRDRFVTTLDYLLCLCINKQYTIITIIITIFLNKSDRCV